MWGAAAAVFATFVVSVIAVRRPPAVAAAPRSIPLGAFAAPLVAFGRFVGIAALLLVIGAGLFGDPHPAKNIAPTLAWIYGWVGLSLFAALLFDPWPLLDPWRALHSPPRAEGPRPAAAIAVVLFLAFAWFEVVDPQSSQPAHIARVLIVWTVITFVGAHFFGRDNWVRGADPLSLYFSTLGRFAPLEIDLARKQLALRPWGRALTLEAPDVPVAFVIAMLATVLFDGILGTQAWRKLDTAFTSWAPGLNDREGVVMGSIGLVATFLAFLGAYALASAIAAAIGGTHGRARVARIFALTLVPIAVAYLVAHNLTYLLVQGQGVLALASDPLGLGWNLFGTAGFTPDASVVTAKATWYVAMTAIVGGHVISVWLAHRVALANWPTARAATIASISLTILMIVYTAVSLAVVAGPLTRFRTPDPSYSQGCENARTNFACRGAIA